MSATKILKPGGEKLDKFEETVSTVLLNIQYDPSTVYKCVAKLYSTVCPP